MGKRVKKLTYGFLKILKHFETKNFNKHWLSLKYTAAVSNLFSQMLLFVSNDKHKK